MKTCGIYCLTNKVSGRRYVGQSRHIEARLRQHQKCGGFAIGAAVQKHGWDAFDVAVLEVCSIEQLNEREQFWIASLATMSPHGYNLTSGGEQYQRFAADVRRRISEATRAGLTPEVVKARAAKIRGIPKSVEWRAAMSERQKSSVSNLERLRAIAQSQSPEQRKKIADTKRGKQMNFTDAGLAAIRQARRDQAAREAAAGIKRVRSPEARAKMSAARKAYFARTEAEAAV